MVPVGEGGVTGVEEIVDADAEGEGARGDGCDGEIVGGGEGRDAVRGYAGFTEGEGGAGACGGGGEGECGGEGVAAEIECGVGGEGRDEREGIVLMITGEGTGKA